jgi:hypothetical protein
MAEKEKPLAIVPVQTSDSVFSGLQAFEDAQRMAMVLISSTMVPAEYRGKANIGNAIVALEMAQRIGASPMAVMQNMHIIQGRPSWGSSFIIGALNSCGRFSSLRFETEDLGDKEIEYTYWTGSGNNRERKTGKVNIKDKSCRAWAYDAGTKDKLFGPVVTMEMAVKEGWYTKKDSKWKTMEDLMLMYRSAAFFGRLYAPDVLMGMHSKDEVEDIGEGIKDITPDLEGAETVKVGGSGDKKEEVVDAEIVEGDQEPEPEQEPDDQDQSEPDPEPEENEEGQDDEDGKEPPPLEPPEEVDLF